MSLKNKALTKDANNNNIQITTKFRSRDGDDTTFSASPFAYTTGIIGLTVPTNAFEFIVNPNTLLHVSDLDTMTDYDEVQASTKEAFPCAEMDNIYIRGGTVGGTINFRFHLL